jgi:hypothetical protein
VHLYVIEEPASDAYLLKHIYITISDSVATFTLHEFGLIDFSGREGEKNGKWTPVASTSGDSV